MTTAPATTELFGMARIEAQLARAQRIEAALRDLRSAARQVVTEFESGANDGDWHNAMHRLDLVADRARAALES